VSNDRAHTADPSTAARDRRFDDETLSRFRTGDREAFLTIYGVYASPLRSLAARFFARPFEREEALQEIWLLVHRMASSYCPDRGELLPWLRALGANRCKELLRAQGRRLAPGAEADEDALLDSSNPEQTARASRVTAAIARFEESLDAEQARVFRLSLVEERSHDEVARALGISARRCKYLRMKLLVRAGADPELRRALVEATEP
jgi:RNA polymerase sigma-70 factor, ECF subfamily